MGVSPSNSTGAPAPDKEVDYDKNEVGCMYNQALGSNTFIYDFFFDKGVRSV